MLVSVMVLAAALGLLIAAPALAGTTTASSFTKTGTDAKTGSVASAANATATAGPGDTLNWALHYQNSTGSSASVNITDPVGPNQSYVAGSLKTPPGLAAQYSTDGGSSWTAGTPPANADAVGAKGSVLPGTTTALSPVFSPSNITFNTPGGDGYSVEGLAGNIYTVFHHSGPNSGAGQNFGATTVYCATLSGAVCPGWPAQSTYVHQTAGAPIGTGGVPPYQTAGENGSFISDGKLFWPVESAAAVGGSYQVGLQCLDLGTQKSCGLTVLDTQAFPPSGVVGGSAAEITGDGIAASDGNYYFFDANGNMLCFNPSSGACGSTNITAGQAATGNTGYIGSILTSGQNVYETYIGSSGSLFMSCYDTATSSTCAGFPKNEGAPGSAGFPDYIAPVLSTSGALLGACDVNKATCYSPAGATITNPYPGYTLFGPWTPTGFGSGAIVGARFYTSDTAGRMLCFDFAAWSGSGAVPQCSGFTGQVDAQNYTVRALANLPGCMAANGNAGQIIIFNATTGGSCTTASQSVKLTPADYYCDGQSGHASSWGTVSLPGLTGSEYGGATVTLLGADGSAVPGWTNVPLPAGSTSLNISSIPVSGNTATLTAQLTMSGVTNTAAVSAAKVQLSWKGDGIEVCFQTVAGPQQCSADQSIDNQGNAITVGANGVSDGPDGDDSGYAMFFEPANPALSGCKADLSVDKTADATKVLPGGQVMYTLVVQNHGPDTATDALVSDPIPAGLSVVSAKPSQGSCTTAGSVDCSLGTILNGGSAQILVVANVSSGAQGSITNCADTSAFQNDPDSANNHSCSTIPVVVPPTPPPAPRTVDVQVVKHVNHPVAKAGEVLTYILNVRNNGPAAAPSVGVTDTSAIGMRVLSIKPSQGTCSKGVPFSCRLGAMAAGKTAKVTIRAIPRQTGSEINSVSSTPGCASDGSCPQDPNTNNNISHAKTRVRPALLLVKTVNDHVVRAGAKLSYRLKVTNPTSVALKHVRVCDRLPAGLTYLSATPKAKLAHGSQCWSYKSLGAHKSRTITLHARARKGVSGAKTNHATATATGVPAAKAKATVRVMRALALVKTVNHHVVNAGHKLTYHLKVTNPNSVAVKHVRVCDRLPLGLVYVGAHPNAKLANGSQCWSYKRLGAHKSKMITLHARALKGASGRKTNHATATGTGVPAAKAKATVRIKATPKPPTPVTG